MASGKLPYCHIVRQYCQTYTYPEPDDILYTENMSSVEGEIVLFKPLKQKHVALVRSMFFHLHIQYLF